MVLIKVWEIASLSVHHVINGEKQTLFVPEVPNVSFICPWAMRLRPKVVALQSSGCVGFESVESASGFNFSNGSHEMDMVCAHIDDVQVPVAMYANFSNGSINTLPLARIECDACRC